MDETPNPVTEGEDDDTPQLSADALAALKDFYDERDSQRKAFEEVKARADADFNSSKVDKLLSIDSFSEDWQQSQFWYSDQTAQALAKELIASAPQGTRIAVVSAPSVFLAIKNLLSLPGHQSERPQVVLLEFDDRFSDFKEFVKYDFAQPTKLAAELKGSFDRIIVDPPFLSSDCQTKAALTVRWLARSWTAENFRLIVCTGERMEELVLKLYAKAGLKTTTFEVVHAKGLSNEFRCYSNFEGAGLLNFRQSAG